MDARTNRNPSPAAVATARLPEPRLAADSAPHTNAAPITISAAMMMAYLGSALGIGPLIGLPSPSVHGLSLVHCAPFHRPLVLRVRR